MAVLTKNIKATILANALDKTFKARSDAIDAFFCELGEAVYAATFTPSTQKKMKALPEGFLPSVDCIRVSFSGESIFLDLKEERLVSYDVKNNWAPVMVFNKKHLLTKAFKDLAKSRDRLEKDESDLRRQIGALLRPITTEKKLLRVWPEAAAFFPPKKNEDYLPAVRPEDVNNMISSMSGG